jgi:hypothetical protein
MATVINDAEEVSDEARVEATLAVNYIASRYVAPAGASGNDTRVSQALHVLMDAGHVRFN